jgi:hypothetical protein
MERELVQPFDRDYVNIVREARSRLGGEDLDS